MKNKFIILVLAFANFHSKAQNKNEHKAVFIENRPWTEARQLLTDTTIVVIPLGAEAKEHGPHLQLKNDWLIAEYLTRRIAVDQHVVIYPTINYHFYPAFLEYAGSTSIRMETAYSMIVDICRVISAHGPRKFYILNTGVSTLAPLKIAKQILAKQGISMEYTDILNVAGEAEKKIKQQKAGTHADEIETSMMLYMYPATVDMKKAARDIPEKGEPGPLTLNPSSARYSATGIYGDATLATREKGEVVVEAMVKGINSEINSLRRAPKMVAPPITNPEVLTGTFTLDGSGDKITMMLEGGQLMMVKGSRRILLLPQTDFSFTAGERGRVVFMPHDKGTPQMLYLNWEGVDYFGHR